MKREKKICFIDYFILCLKSFYFNLFSIFFIFAIIFNLSAQENADNNNIQASVVKVVGKYSIMRANKTGWEKAQQGELLYPGDKVMTYKNSKILLIFIDGVEVTVDEKSEFEINPKEELEKVNLKMKIGRIWNKVIKRQTKFQIMTPMALLSVRGTQFELSVLVSGFTSIFVLEGIVEVRNSKGSVKVGSGQKTVVENDNYPPSIPVEQKITDKEKKEDWKEEIKLKGNLKIKLNYNKTIIKNIISGSIKVIDENNRLIKDLTEDLIINSNNDDIFVSDDKLKWLNELKLECKNGEGNFYVKSDKETTGTIKGSYKDFVSDVEEIVFKAPKGKNIFINYEKEDGQSGTLKLNLKK